MIKALPPVIHDAVLEIFVRSIHTVFLVAVPIVLVGIVLAFLLPEQKLKERAQPPGETAGPADAEVAAIKAT